MKLRKARKAYRCIITNREINIGDEYVRVNIRGHGVLHFHKTLDSYDIKDYLMNEIIMPRMNMEDRDKLPEVWDSREREIWADMPDEF